MLVNIIITTYDPGNGVRFEMLKRTLRGLKDNLQYPELAWIISDDGSQNFPKEEIDNLLQGNTVTYLNANRGGVGRSKNISLELAFKTSPLVLLLEDDWVLKEPLNLGYHVDVLQNNPQVGMIRFGFLGGTIHAHLTDYGYPKTYWTLEHRSGHYVYSGQVSLRHERFYQKVGYHVEGVQAGMEEDEMCHRYNNLDNVPDILWPTQYGSMLNCGPFINIGMSDSVNAVNP